MSFASPTELTLCPQLYTAEQVSAIDTMAIDTIGIPATHLMKRAGQAAFALLLEQWPEVCHIDIFCGGGNNGGDGYVIAALAAQRNIPVAVWQLAPADSLSGGTAEAYDFALQAQVSCQSFNVEQWQLGLADTKREGTRQPRVIVDAILGIGAQRDLTGDYKIAVEAINQAVLNGNNTQVLAMDTPTGVDANTGNVSSVAVKAALTLSVVGQKQGLFTGAGRVHSGQRYFTDLGIIAKASTPMPVANAHIIDASSLLAALPERPLDAHKGSHGQVLVVGGDCGAGYGYGGAPLMAASMALRAGAGLVSLATRTAFVAPALARQPEMMVAAIESGQAILPMLQRAAILVVGPGLGQSAWSEQLLYHTLAANKPMVLDADALNLLAQERFASAIGIPKAKRQWILTPHPGEAARLLDTSIESIEADRWLAAQRLQQRFGGVVVLKGPGTVVADNNGKQWLCDHGNPGMASGGMGDVLSGLLGSLLAQGMPVTEAACLGVALHSIAADNRVARQGQRGLLATDLIDEVRALLNSQGELINYG